MTLAVELMQKELVAAQPDAILAHGPACPYQREIDACSMASTLGVLPVSAYRDDNEIEHARFKSSWTGRASTRCERGSLRVLDHRCDRHRSEFPCIGQRSEIEDG